MLAGEHGVRERLGDAVHVALHPALHGVQDFRSVVVHPKALVLEQENIKKKKKTATTND